jgi:hypothetical protein
VEIAFKEPPLRESGLLGERCSPPTWPLSAPRASFPNWSASPPRQPFRSQPLGLLLKSCGRPAIRLNNFPPEQLSSRTTFLPNNFPPEQLSSHLCQPSLRPEGLSLYFLYSAVKPGAQGFIITGLIFLPLSFKCHSTRNGRDKATRGLEMRKTPRCWSIQ